MRELTQISSQMSSSLSRVRKEDVQEAKRQAAKLAENRDAMNSNPRREEITKEIRVQEDKLKSIATTIEQDTKIRDQLRLKQNEQNEIDMLDKQVEQEYALLEELIRDNSFLISSHGESVNITKEDPIAPVEVLATNVRSKFLDAQTEMDRCASEVANVQKKVSEKKALLGSHKQRYQTLLQKKSFLMSESGGAQKIKSVIKAVLRQDADIDVQEKLNEDSHPTEVLKYIADQVEEASKHEEKPEQIAKVIKRLKKLVRLTKTFLFCC